MMKISIKNEKCLLVFIRLKPTRSHERVHGPRSSRLSDIVLIFVVLAKVSHFCALADNGEILVQRCCDGFRTDSRICEGAILCVAGQHPTRCKTGSLNPPNRNNHLSFGERSCRL